MREVLPNDRVVYSSSTDVHAVITLPNGQSYKFGTIAQLTYSKHRDKFPVGGLGSRNIRGFTKGHQITGGSLVFKTLDRQVFYRVMDFVPKGVDADLHDMNREYENNTNLDEQRYPDQLPPFDIMVIMQDDLGNVSTEVFRGVVLHGVGLAFSIDSLDILQTYQFSARCKEKLDRAGRDRTLSSMQTQPGTDQPNDVGLTSKIEWESTS